jgi:acylphosphatase
VSSETKTITIVVKGKVQGVYFRQSTRDLAEQLQITGNVANQKDGSVLILATGLAVKLQQLVEWCGRGPSGAKVTDVQVTELPLKEFDGFRIVRSY